MEYYIGDGRQLYLGRVHSDEFPHDDEVPGEFRGKTFRVLLGTMGYFSEIPAMVIEVDGQPQRVIEQGKNGRWRDEDQILVDLVNRLVPPGM